MKKLFIATILIFVSFSSIANTQVYHKCESTDSEKLKVVTNKDFVTIETSSGEVGKYQIERKYLTSYRDSETRYEAVYLSGSRPNLDLETFGKITLNVPSSTSDGDQGSLAFRKDYFGEITSFYYLSCKSRTGQKLRPFNL